MNSPDPVVQVLESIAKKLEYIGTSLDILATAQTLEVHFGEMKRDEESRRRKRRTDKPQSGRLFDEE